MPRHWKGAPANGCSGCGHDFTSTNLFDRHRVGRYEFTLEQGLKLDPPQENGRRSYRRFVRKRLNVRLMSSRSREPTCARPAISWPNFGRHYGTKDTRESRRFVGQSRGAGTARVHTPAWSCWSTPLFSLGRQGTNLRLEPRRLTPGGQVCGQVAPPNRVRPYLTNTWRTHA